MDSSDLIEHFKSNKTKFRIEIEGRESSLKREGIEFNDNTDYIKSFPEGTNKWANEYRLYFNGYVPDNYRDMVCENSFYNKDEYKNIINNNELIRDMLDNGCNLGDNEY